MSEADRQRFCAEDIFDSILRRHSTGEHSGYGQALLLQHVMPKGRDYDAALDVFRSSLAQMGFEVTPYEVKRLPAEIEVMTMARKSGTGKWIEARFFNVLPSVPDALLNAIAVALTVGGLVTAPLTGGASIAVSCVAMGLAIANNSKRETDPVRLEIYAAIGETARRNAEEAAQDAHKDSALTRPELAHALGLSDAEIDARLPGLLERSVLNRENAVPAESYRESNFFTERQTSDDNDVQCRVGKACADKWRRLTRSFYVYPTLDDIASATRRDPEVVSQALAVLVEKNIVTIKRRDGKAHYWYTV